MRPVTIHAILRELNATLVNGDKPISKTFDAEVPTATRSQRKETEEEQVKALLERKGGFSASAIFTNAGTMCVTSGAIIKAKIIQLEKKLRKIRIKSRRKQQKVTNAY